MTLDRFLLKHRISTAKFAKVGGFSFHTVAKWRQRKRIPRWKALAKIESLTEYKVRANDWYSGK